MSECGCHRCINERGDWDMDPETGLTKTMIHMVLCPLCGNKRCPHANDHRNKCTDSNDPGQPGSAYP